MAAKTRRDARKGRSTRRSRRAAKGGGLFGSCFRGACSSRDDGLYSRKDISKHVEGLGWEVKNDPNSSNSLLASCGDTEEPVSAIYVKDDDSWKYDDADAWEYPTNICRNEKIVPNNKRVPNNKFKGETSRLKPSWKQNNVVFGILPATPHPYDGAHMN